MAFFSAHIPRRALELDSTSGPWSCSPGRAASSELQALPPPKRTPNTYPADSADGATYGESTRVLETCSQNLSGAERRRAVILFLFLEKETHLFFFSFSRALGRCDTNEKPKHFFRQEN